jgi:hypothetical protein
MALLFCEGFDKYGGANSYGAGVSALLTAGEWNSTSASPAIVAPLSQTGQALSLGTITKTLPGAYGRLIGGLRFNSPLGTVNLGLQFLDGGSSQAAVQINTTGTVSVRNGLFNSGTVLGTSTASITANTTHYIEFDITLANAGSYQVWMDGVSILSGSGDTTTTANSSATGIAIQTAGGTAIVDDFYVFDASGTTNNAALLTSPRIETQFPTGDAAVQFAAGAAILGSSVTRSGTNQATIANQMRLRAVTPAVACTLNSIAFQAGGTGNGAIQLRPVVYSNVGAAPGVLLVSGATVTGTTAGAVKTMPVSTPLALTAGTTYWIGHMCDVAQGAALTQLSAANDDVTSTATFAAGAPGSAPTGTAAVGTVLWANVTVSGANWFAVSQAPPQGNLSYVFDAVVAHEDLYTYPPLSVPPSAIYAVAVKANLSKSDAGAKTVSMRMKSGATDSAGTTASAAPGTGYGWLSSHFATDPATGAAWTLTGINAAQSGVKIET